MRGSGNLSRRKVAGHNRNLCALTQRRETRSERTVQREESQFADRTFGKKRRESFSRNRSGFNNRPFIGRDALLKQKNQALRDVESA